jgi:manganese-dependent inorganic pyrophosphatase
MSKETIYIIGHKSPDTDTVCSSIAYAEFLKKKKVDAIAAIPEELNPETKYILDYFKVKKPLKLNSIKGKKVFLVDHNESSQSPEGINEAEVIGIIDHHKIGCSFSAPIFFESKPLGSTATLIAQKMIEQQFKITKQLAGILLSAILSDTVIFKSSTTTEEDIKIAKILGEIAGIKNIKEFGIEIKKQKSNLKGMSAEKIIYSDFKIFEEDKVKFGVGQIETVDLEEVKEKKAELLKKMKEVIEKERLSFLILMLTDIINEGSELLISGESTYLKKAFNKEIKNDSIYIKNMMSRKKDLIPLLAAVMN